MHTKKFQFTLSNGLDNESFQSTSISVSISHFYFIGVISLIMLVFPLSWLVFFMPLTCFSLVLVGVPTYLQPYLSKINIIVPILQMLQKTNILQFFINLHSIVFYTQLRIYQFFVIFCYGLTILYMLIGRYVFYHKVVLYHEFSYWTLFIVSILLFISFCGSYLRILINISNILVSVTRQYAPEFLDPLLRMDPPDFPPGTKRSLFSFSRHTHNHNHYPPLPKTGGWSRIGIIAACTGVAVSSGALYYTRQQYLEAHRQTLEAQKQTNAMQRQLAEITRQNDTMEYQLAETKRQNDAMEYQLTETKRQNNTMEYQLAEIKRQNDTIQSQLVETKRQKDLTELSQGIMTKEEYKKRYTKD